ncbi:MAG: hypothetical protein DCF17_21885 [Shackletoniella antarctica]|uniref:DUF202 domain-containing protein n=1 Tax=Shackletoniella antarctica TaxID=268115 RepID=A0A2W4VLR7_9CYAN|nr:MAG: hypothetical protein DCF17_21885 [Shackletoniella antarctica]
MGDLPPQMRGNPTNELAKERNRAAAERTLNAWTGVCLSLIGFGVAFDRVVSSLGGRAAAMPEPRAALVGLVFIGVGLVLLGFALVQHRLAIASIERHDYVLSSIHTLNRLAVATIVLAGLAGLAVVLVLR